MTKTDGLFPKPKPHEVVSVEEYKAMLKGGGKRIGRTTHVDGRMNKTEAAFSVELEARKRAGEIRCWLFESVKLRLATRAFYTTDFLVEENDFRITLYEIKGHVEDDAALKVRFCRERYPMFRLIVLQYRKGEWVEILKP